MTASGLRAPRALVAALVVVNGLYAFNQMLVVPVLPTIERDLHTSTARVTWLLSLFLLVSCVATPVLGKLSDQFGRRRLLIAVLAVFLLGTVGAALAPNIWVLIAARALQAVSSSLAPIAIGLLRGILPREAMHRALGAIMSVTMIGAGLGAAVSGLVVDWLGWRYLFAISAAVVLACLVVAAVATPHDAIGTRVPMDAAGAVMLSGGLAALVLALTEGAGRGWTSPAVLGLLGAAAAVFALWLRHEQRVPFPLVDVRVLGRRPMLVANVAQSLSAFGMTALIVLVPRLVATPPTEGVGYGLGASTTAIGLYLLPISISGLVAGGLAARIGRRWGFRRSLVLGQLVGAAALASLIPWHDRGWHIVLVMLAVGLTIPLVNTAVNAMVVDGVGAGDVGVSTGILVVFRHVGATIGAQLSAGVLGSAVVAGTAIPTETAFQLAFAIGVAGAIVGTGIVLAGLRGPLREGGGPEAEHEASSPSTAWRLPSA